MYYQEKKTITSIISGMILLAYYIIYGFQKYQEEGAELLSDLKFWASTMLLFIGAGIVVIIIIQIVFHIILAIANEVSKEVSKKSNRKGSKETYEGFEIAEVEDEMDRLIALKALRNSSIVVGAGFVSSLIFLYLGKPPAIMLNITFLSFSLGSIFEGFSQLYFYRKGVRSG